MREVIITLILYGFDQKNQFFDGYPWIEYNNLGLALGMAFKFFTSVAKGFKLKVRKFWRLIPTFVRYREKLVGEAFLFPPFSHPE